MSNLLKNSKFLKWIYFALGILSGVIVISSLFFMTQYRFVRVNYNEDETGKKVYTADAKLNKASQKNLFDFINNLANKEYEKISQENGDSTSEAQTVVSENEYLKIIFETDSSESGYKMLNKEETGNKFNKKTTYTIKSDYFSQLDEFRTSLDKYNDLILWYGIVSLIVFACLLILSNQSRRIYYKSNLIGGILLPLVNVVFSLVLIIQALPLISNINNPTNKALYNVVSSIQNPVIGGNYVSIAASDATNLTQINTIVSQFNVDATTLIMYIIFFAITAVFNIFLIVVAVMKYKATASERKDVLEKARLAGEKA